MLFVFFLVLLQGDEILSFACPKNRQERFFTQARRVRLTDEPNKRKYPKKTTPEPIAIPKK